MREGEGDTRPGSPPLPLKGFHEFDQSALVCIGKIRYKVVPAIFDKVRTLADFQQVRNQLQQQGTGQEPSSSGTTEPEPVKAVPLILSAIKQSSSDLLRKIAGGSPPGKDPES